MRKISSPSTFFFFSFMKAVGCLDKLRQDLWPDLISEAVELDFLALLQELAVIILPFIIFHFRARQFG